MGFCFYFQTLAPTSAHCIVYLEQTLRIQSQAQQGAASGDEAIFSLPLFIRRISLLYVNGLLNISGCQQRGKKVTNTQPTLTCSLHHSQRVVTAIPKNLMFTPIWSWTADSRRVSWAYGGFRVPGDTGGRWPWCE